MMARLKDLGQLSKENPTVSRAVEAFRCVRHCLGRLGRRVQAIRELVHDGMLVHYLLDEYEVARVPVPECIPTPLADGHTSLRGILRRMIRPDDQRWQQVEELLPQLNLIFPSQGLEDAVLEYYEKESFRPIVHAEVQMLEHFHSEGRQFARNDRFIATSKPACICCELYFRHHPARCVVPESHRKVYVNWGTINLPGGREHPGFVAQRGLLGKITDDVREAALDRVFQMALPWPFHHDSITEITSIDDLDISSEQSSVDGFPDTDVANGSGK